MRYTRINIVLLVDECEVNTLAYKINTIIKIKHLQAVGVNESFQIQSSRQEISIILSEKITGGMMETKVKGEKLTEEVVEASKISNRSRCWLMKVRRRFQLSRRIIIWHPLFSEKISNFGLLCSV